jgi:hypothetical protein
MKEKITAFINNLILYDYILFGSVFALFILILILALVLRKKTTISAILALCSFAILFIGPTVGYVKMHEFLFPTSIKLVSQKKLTYTPAIVVSGELTNISKRNFKRCKISALALRQSKNKIKTYIYRFKPLKKMSILEENIAKGETRVFKIIIEPFTSNHDYNISIKADCQ